MTDDGRSELRSFMVRLPLAFAAAVAMAWGAALGWALPPEPAATTVAATMLAVVSTAVRGRAGRRLVVAAMCLAGTTFAAIEAADGPDPGAASCGGMPVEMHGIVATEPRARDDGSDELAAFAPGDASRSFALEVSAVRTAAGMRAAAGHVTVRVAGLAALPGRGSGVGVRGWMEFHEHRLNPGVRAREPTAVVEVPSARLVTALGASWPGTWLIGLRAWLHRGLRASMPGWASDGERALVAAMTVGTRLPGLGGHAAEFRDAGMSHVLAISGFNVAVLVGASATVARMAGLRAAGRAVMALAVAASFLAVTEPETSVLRAGLGAALAAVAGMRGGRARGIGVLGASAVVSMAIDVRCIRGAGFQLSYGVVLALLALAPVASRRWADRWRSMCSRALAPLSAMHEAATVIGGWLVTACCAAAVAWSASTPIALAHGGSLAPLAAPLAVLTMPVAAVTTVAGVVAMAIGGVVPAIACMPGAVAACGARFLALTAGFGSSVAPAIGPATPAPWWMALAAATAVAVAWLAASLRTRALSATAAAAVVGLVLLAPHGAAERPGAGALVVDRLALGSGGCMVVRDGPVTVLVDAGSAAVDAGSRTIVPALRALGVRQVDLLVIGSPSFASVSAVPEVIRTLGVVRIACTPATLDRLSSDERGHGAALLRFMRSRGIPVQAVPADAWVDAGPVAIRLNHGRSATGRPRVESIDVRGGGLVKIDAMSTVARAATRMEFTDGGPPAVRSWGGDRWLPLPVSRTEAPARGGA